MKAWQDLVCATNVSLCICLPRNLFRNRVDMKFTKDNKLLTLKVWRDVVVFAQDLLI